MIKNFIAVFLILFLSNIFYSYTAKVLVYITSKELKISINYNFTNDTIKIIFPDRARILQISSPEKGNIDYSKLNNQIILYNLKTFYNGIINISYTLPVNSLEFILTNWLLLVSEDGEITANISIPENYKSLIIPFDFKNNDGFHFKQSYNPIIFCSKYNVLEQLFKDFFISYYYNYKINYGINEIQKIFKTYETLFMKLNYDNLYIITLPALQDYILFKSNNIFVVVNNNNLDHIKRNLSLIWLKGILNFKDDYLFAFSDLYKRLINDNGEIQNEDSVIVPVPSYLYYSNVIANGLKIPNEYYCDVNNMLKNFSLLHLVYYTIKRDNFFNMMREFLETKDYRIENFNDYLLKYDLTKKYVSFILDNIFPVANWIPDLRITKNFVYRNNNNIPDIYIFQDKNKKIINWDNKNVYNLDNYENLVILDPDNLIPQLNFYNDKAFNNINITKEIEIIYDFILKHKYYPQETFREILNLERIIVNFDNYFNIEKDSAVYVAVIKISAPISGRLVYCLKDLIIRIKDNKPYIVLSRIRY